MSIEKDVVVVAAGGAYDLYLKYGMYCCQPGRSFQPVERMGFYTGNEIKPYFPRILARRDHVGFDLATAQDLRMSLSEDEAAFGHLVEQLLTDGVFEEGVVQQIFLLSPTDDPRTMVLPRSIRNASMSKRGQRVAWTQNQRYVSSAELEAAPETTAGLANAATGQRESSENKSLRPRHQDDQPGNPLCSVDEGRQAESEFPGVGDVVQSASTAPHMLHYILPSMTGVSVPATGGALQALWFQEIRDIHDKHFEDPWQERADAINQRYALSRQHMLLTPEPGVPIPWFNGNIEAVQPGHWVLVISLNHANDPDSHEALGRSGGTRYTRQTYWDHWRTFNTDHWYGKFFGPLARVAAAAFGEELTKEQAPAFATDRMIFVEICPYGSKRFNLPWATVEELLTADLGFQLAARVNRLLIEKGNPALAIVNGARAVDMVKHLYADSLHWREVRYDSCGMPQYGRKPNQLTHYCGSLNVGRNTVPIVGFPFLRTSMTHNSNPEVAQLGDHVRQFVTAAQ